MTLREEINACTPRLRRYARALATGAPAPSRFADDLVHVALQRAVAERRAGREDIAIRLYGTITQLHREAAGAGRCALAADVTGPAMVGGPLAPIPVARQSRLSVALMSLPIEDREALLLVALEGFDHADAARILRVSRSTLLGRLTSARRAFDLQIGTTHSSTPQRAAPRPRAAPHLRVVT